MTSGPCEHRIDHGALSGTDGDTDAQIEQWRQGCAEASVPWLSGFETLAIEAPDFLREWIAFAGTQGRNGPLSAKERQLIRVALALSVTHLDEQGTEDHVREAVRLGASRAELVQLSQLSTLLGVHAMPVALEALIAETERAGLIIERADDFQSDETKASFVASRGLLPPDLVPLAEIAPEVLDAYRSLSRSVVSAGALEAKFIEFAIIALDVSTTHMFSAGAALHVRNALALGATTAELIDVFRVACETGISGTMLGIRVIDRVFATR